MATFMHAPIRAVSISYTWDSLCSGMDSAIGEDTMDLAEQQSINRYAIQPPPTISISTVALQSPSPQTAVCAHSSISVLYQRHFSVFLSLHRAKDRLAKFQMEIAEIEKRIAKEKSEEAKESTLEQARTQTQKDRRRAESEVNGLERKLEECSYYMWQLWEQQQNQSANTAGWLPLTTNANLGVLPSPPPSTGMHNSPNWSALPSPTWSLSPVLPTFEKPPLFQHPLIARPFGSISEAFDSTAYEAGLYGDVEGYGNSFARSGSTSSWTSHMSYGEVSMRADSEAHPNAYNNGTHERDNAADGEGDGESGSAAESGKPPLSLRAEAPIFEPIAFNGRHGKVLGSSPGDLLESPKGTIVTPSLNNTIAYFNSPVRATADVDSTEMNGSAGRPPSVGPRGKGKGRSPSQPADVVYGPTATINKAAIETIEWRLAHPSERKSRRRKKLTSAGSGMF